MKKILFVSPVRFDALKQRHQGLSIELSKNGYFVYFLNPIISNGFQFVEKTNELAKNIKIIDIKIPFKAVSYPIIQNFAVSLAFKLLKKKLHIDPAKYILWLAEPSCAKLTEYNWEKIIYDCCDLHGFFPNQKKRIWQQYEEKITEKANLITLSHLYIKEHFYKETQKKCLLIPNATFFQVEKKQESLANDGKIKILSSGAHYEWVDIDWLKMIAGLDNVELHIAGKGRGPGFKQLISMKNVKFHGELDTYQLFELMKVCKVGLLAFKDIELIKGVDPIKVYDYAAAGLEIWAPDIKALYSNKYINTFIKDADSANKALNNLNENKKEYCFFEIPTWKERLKEILRYL